MRCKYEVVDLTTGEVILADATSRECRGLLGTFDVSSYAREGKHVRKRYEIHQTGYLTEEQCLAKRFPDAPEIIKPYLRELTRKRCIWTYELLCEWAEIQRLFGRCT